MAASIKAGDNLMNNSLDWISSSSLTYEQCRNIWLPRGGGRRRGSPARGGGASCAQS